MSVRTIVDALGERAYALLIVVLGLPNCLPMPPPIPLICGILLMFVAVQIIVGWPSPWLPKRLLDRSIARGDLVKASSRAVPWLQMAGEGRQAAAGRVRPRAGPAADGRRAVRCSRWR